MQFQVDAGDSRPTFFELIAADRLVPSLRAALVYSLGVLAARRPGLTRILDHEAEAFAALMLLVETHSFATSDGSLAEGLYGLQRSRRVGGVGGGDAGGLAAALAKGGLPSQLGAGNNSPGNNDGGGARIPRRIGRKQRLLSVAMLVGLPYAREKLDALYVRLSGANGMGTQSALGSTIAEAILGEHAPPALPRRSSRDDTTRADDGMGGEDAPGRGNAGGREDAGPSGNGGAQLASSTSSSSQLASSRPSRDLRTSAANAFVAAYPWIHAGWEGVVFWCWLRYILTSGETHDPALWLLRLCTTRVSPAEASLRRAATESNRASRLDRMSSPRSSWVNRHVGTRLTRAGYFALDYAQGGLMAAVVGFKLLEWWYGSAEEMVFAHRNLPTPPPPPRTTPHPRARVRVPQDRRTCPLCRKRCASPAVVRTSGWVFCHTCAVDEIRRRGKCPVTLAPATDDDVVRLFSE